MDIKFTEGWHNFEYRKPNQNELVECTRIIRFDSEFMGEDYPCPWKDMKNTRTEELWWKSIDKEKPVHGNNGTRRPRA